MARKNEDNSAPVVTSLPLPSSDSVLVIDLPDGQKLLVGKMNHGTVIEVATWRGTGRPDSRTNRLMLGMSSSESEGQVNSQDSEDEMVVDKRSVKYWIWLAAQISKKAKDLVVTSLLKMKALLSKKSNKANTSKPVESIEDDVQAWLDNIKSSQPKKSDLALSGPAKSTKFFASPQVIVLFEVSRVTIFSSGVNSVFIFKAYAC
jgi:hypothetical protein